MDPELQNSPNFPLKSFITYSLLFPDITPRTLVCSIIWLTFTAARAGPINHLVRVSISSCLYPPVLRTIFTVSFDIIFVAFSTVTRGDGRIGLDSKTLRKVNDLVLYYIQAVHLSDLNPHHEAETTTSADRARAPVLSRTAKSTSVPR